MNQLSVQLLSHVQLFATPWTVAHQASLSITNCQSLLKLMSIEFPIPLRIKSKILTMACKALHDMTLLSFSAFLSHIPQDPQSHLHQLLSWNVSSTLQPQDSGTGFWVYGPVNLLLLSTQNIPLSSMFSTKITTWQTPSFSLNLCPVRLILISSFKITNLHPLLQFLPVIHLALHFFLGKQK